MGMADRQGRWQQVEDALPGWSCLGSIRAVGGIISRFHVTCRIWVNVFATLPRFHVFTFFTFSCFHVFTLRKLGERLATLPRAPTCSRGYP